jgi:hypothetical protein
MSSISPDPRLDRAGPLASQAALDQQQSLDRLDDLRRGEQGQGASPLDVAEAGYASEALVTQEQVDSGEDVLNAGAWDDVPEGARYLAGDGSVQAQLGSLDLSQAADRAADLILEPFAEA